MELYNQIVKFLKSLPNMHETKERRALIYSASLDKELEDQIEFEGTADQFCQLLVKTLGTYGTLNDGRHALEAILEAAKHNVGQEGKEHCDELRQQVCQGGYSSEKEALEKNDDHPQQSNTPLDRGLLTNINVRENTGTLIGVHIGNLP